MLLFQTLWGPRCFVPKRFLPAKYDYHRPVVPREVAQGALDSGLSTDVETGDGGEHNKLLLVLWVYQLLLENESYVDQLCWGAQLRLKCRCRNW